ITDEGLDELRPGVARPGEVLGCGEGDLDDRRRPPVDGVRVDLPLGRDGALGRLRGDVPRDLGPVELPLGRGALRGGYGAVGALLGEGGREAPLRDARVLLRDPALLVADLRQERDRELDLLPDRAAAVADRPAGPAVGSEDLRLLDAVPGGERADRLEAAPAPEG